LPSSLGNEGIESHPAIEGSPDTPGSSLRLKSDLQIPGLFADNSRIVIHTRNLQVVVSLVKGIPTWVQFAGASEPLGFFFNN